MPTLGLLILLLLMLVPAADAQVIYRCRMDDGSALYTDRPCHVMNSVPMTAPDAAVEPPPEAVLPDSPPPIPAAANGCPAIDPPALQLAVQSAVSKRDLNALAGLYAWDGAGRVHADHVLDKLRALIDSRPGQLRLLEPDGWTWAPSAEPQAALPRLHLYRDAGGEHSYSSFQLVSGSGCVWLGG